MKDKLSGPLIFLGLVVLGVIIYVLIYFYSLSLVGKPPF